MPRQSGSAWRWTVAAVGICATAATTADDWPHYGGDAGGRRFSGLSQIDAGNVARLERAWHIHTGEMQEDPPPPAHMAFEATPLVVDGRMLLPTPSGRVLALDPASGRELWRFGARAVSNTIPEYTSRGVAIWSDEAASADVPCRQRVFAATNAYRLFSIDAASGAPCSGFGTDGSVDLREGVGTLQAWDYATSSPPVVHGDLVILGAAISDNQRIDAPRGIVRAWDARSGKLRWWWDPVPRDAGDPQHAGWSAEAARHTGAANAWAPLSVDHERGLLFVPTSSPSPDYYGGERPGDNRYANSVVALRAATGEVAWHYQLVHHDLWDYDVPAQPTLATLRRDGVGIPVVVQASKMGFLFVLHRETGEPVFPVEERAVPGSDVPGEHASPTQPFPLALPQLATHARSTPEAWGLTPLDRAACRRQLAALRYEGIFTPPSLQGTLLLPGYSGGANWGGVAMDETRQILVANVTNLPFMMRLIPRERFASERAASDSGIREFAPQHGTPFGLERGPLLSPLMLPCIAPPWGTLNAVSLSSGALLWSVPLGTVPDRVPLPLGITLGLPNLGGPLLTAGGLVFIAAAMDGYLRAFDLHTGKALWKDRLPAGGNATPMSYAVDGRQYVALAAGGHGKLGTRAGDSVIAWRLPSAP